MNRVAAELEAMATLIDRFDASSAQYVRSLRGKRDQEIARDLNLWGGSGSVMDQALVGQPRDVRRGFEAAAVRLGNALQEQGARDRRMENWVRVFESWAKEGV